MAKLLSPWRWTTWGITQWTTNYSRSIVKAKVEERDYQGAVHIFDGIIFTEGREHLWNVVISGVQWKSHDPNSISLINVAKNGDRGAVNRGKDFTQYTIVKFNLCSIWRQLTKWASSPFPQLHLLEDTPWPWAWGKTFSKSKSKSKSIVV